MENSTSWAIKKQNGAFLMDRRFTDVQQLPQRFFFLFCPTARAGPILKTVKNYWNKKTIRCQATD